MPKKVIRSALHEVMKGRKAAVHRPKEEKRAAQKMRKAIREQLD